MRQWPATIGGHESLSLLLKIDHQTFAIHASGRLVSAAEVARGLACDCKCQLCDEALVAKQGDVRTWHFAHQSNADCTGGLETLLHQAAKQVLLEAREIHVPEVVIGRAIRGEDGGMWHGVAVRPAGMLPYKEPQTEVGHGTVRPDVQVMAEFGPVFVEIAVTNAVSGAKFARLLELKIPTLEITPWMPRNPGRNAWDAVRHAVLHAPENRRWLVLPEIERLAAEAIANAKPIPAPARRQRHEFEFGRTQVRFGPRKNWLQVRVTTTDFEIDPLVAGWLAKWGGRFDRDKGVWWFRAAETERLRAALTILAERIARQSPAEQHQRVLEAYYRKHAQ